MTVINQDVQKLSEIVESVRDLPSEKAAYAIVAGATDLVKAHVDPASPVGQELVAGLLRSIEYGGVMTNTHSAYHIVMATANKLSPKK